MALWDDLVTEITTITNRPDLTAETSLALRQAVRAAHKSGKYWRDLSIVLKTGLSTTEALQSIDISADLPRFRQMAYVKSGSGEFFYKAVDINNLLDDYDSYVLDVYYAVGTSLKIRGSAPEASYELCYYAYPIVTPTSSFASWIADEHRDLLVAWGASNVLSMVGEQEIKGRMDQLVALGLADLREDNIELIGR